VKTTLSDDQRSVRVEVAEEPGGLALYPAGYGLCACADGTAGPIRLEVHEGRLRLVVWDDINLEDPSHVIDLEGAREDHRRDIAGNGVRRLISSAASR
jgi:hypothetical protein